jgi:hypothetical protein
MQTAAAKAEPPPSEAPSVLLTDLFNQEARMQLTPQVIVDQLGRFIVVGFRV